MEIIKVIKQWYEQTHLTKCTIDSNHYMDGRSFFSMFLCSSDTSLQPVNTATMSMCNDNTLAAWRHGTFLNANKAYLLFIPVLNIEDSNEFQDFISERIKEINSIYNKQFITDFRKITTEEKTKIVKYGIDIQHTLPFYAIEADKGFALNAITANILTKLVRLFILRYYFKKYQNKPLDLTLSNFADEIEYYDNHNTFSINIKHICYGTELIFNHLDFLLKHYDYLVSFLRTNEVVYGASSGTAGFINSDMFPIFKRYVLAESKKEEFLKQQQMQYQTKKIVKLQVFSRHPTHDSLREVKLNYRVLFRLGSTTETPEKMKGRYIEINSIDAIKNSASKVKMKHCFEKVNLKQAAWIMPVNRKELSQWASQYENSAFVVKSEFGSRNEGNTYCENSEILLNFMDNNNRYGRNFIVEKYYNYSREYRLHVTKEGCFYTCRKMLRRDAEERWFRNSANSVWVVEENAQFDKPTIWKNIEEECVKALNAVGLDVGACDVIVTSAKNKEQNFIICEINSAPSFGERTFEEYQDILPVLINQKLSK